MQEQDKDDEQHEDVEVEDQSKKKQIEEGKHEEEKPLTKIQQRKEEVFVLTEELSSYKGNTFVLVWRVLQKLGWTYSQKGYFPPKDSTSDMNLTFGSAIELTEYLDGKVKKRSKRSRRDNIVEYETQTSDAKKMKEAVLRQFFRDYEKDVVEDSSISSSPQETPLRQQNCRNSKAVKAKEEHHVDKGANTFIKKKGPSSKKSSTTTVPTTSILSSNIPVIQKPDVSNIPKVNDLFPNEHEEKYLKNDYIEWYFLSQTNHSLLFTGFGSKYKLLNDFAAWIHTDNEYEPCHMNTIDGFDKEVTGIEYILQTFFEEVIEDIEHPPKITSLSYLRQATYIAETFRKKKLPPAYLVIHNIDAPVLRTYEAQSVLSALTSRSFDSNLYTTYIRIIASTDQIDAPDKLWDTITKNEFKWIQHDTPTYRRYNLELLRCNLDQHSFFFNKSSSVSLGNKGKVTFQALGFSNVFDSLAPRNLKVIQELARMQTINATTNTNTNSNTTNINAVEYGSFRKQCQERMHISQTSQLLPIVSELGDHKLINKFVNENNVDMIHIPYPKYIMKSILDYKRK